MHLLNFQNDTAPLFAIWLFLLQQPGRMIQFICTLGSSPIIFYFPLGPLFFKILPLLQSSFNQIFIIILIYNLYILYIHTIPHPHLASPSPIEMKNHLIQSADFSVSSLFPLRKQASAGPKGSDLEGLLQGSSSKKRNKENTGDRFIPSKISSNAYNLLTDCTNNPVATKTPVKGSHKTHQTYEALLSQQILGECDPNANTKPKKIMHFNNQENSGSKENGVAFMPQSNLARSDTKTRKIQKNAYKILEAPSLQDDFYLNLLDWSSHNNIAVGLESSVYLWSGCSSKVVQLYETEDISDYICSVSFAATNPNHVGIGNTLGQIKLFDVVKRKQLHTLPAHTGRVGSLNWSPNGPLLASGARDGTVAIWDSRQSDLVDRYKAHGQQICGLKWSNEGNYIASGGNDNKLVVYSSKANKELVRFNQHKAAVKAIGWVPDSSGTLASGGGTADRHIRFFSTHSLTQTQAYDTGSQVCNLVFSKVSKEMVSTHGYSLNQINVWSTNTNWEQGEVQKIATLTGHTYRVLYLASSPDGSSVLTGAGDETLRYWNVFDKGDLVGQESLNFTADLR